MLITYANPLKSGSIILTLIISLFLFLNVNGQDFSQFDCQVEIGNTVITMPFTGGLSSPQISTEDFNFDGHNDILMFDKAGNTPIILINEGSFDPSYRYDLSYEKYFPEVRGLMLLRDFDGDGIKDLFAFNQIGSSLDMYRGIRVGNHIEYELYEFNIPGYDYYGLFYRNGSDTIEIYVAPGDLPGIEDIDGDGDLDILSFLVGGSIVNYFKNMSVELGYGTDTLIYELVDDCWGKMRRASDRNELILSENSSDCPSSFHSPNTSASRHTGAATFCLLDDNGDGLLDVILGDDQSGRMIMLTNGGTLDEAWMIAQDTMYPSYTVPFDMPIFASAYFEDIDNDGIKDLLATTNDYSSSNNTDNIWFYKNIASTDNPLFELQSESLLVDDILDFGSFSAPCFVDENQDGLMDIVVGNYGYIEDQEEPVTQLALLRNVGDIDNPQYKLINRNYLNFSSFQTEYSEHIVPAFGDLDGDGDLDLVIGDSRGSLYYLENTAGANNPLTFANADYPYMDIKVSSFAKPAMVDINQDGLMDIVVGEKNANEKDGVIGCLNYYQNQGNTGSPFFNNDEYASPNNPVLGAVDLRQGDFIFPRSAPCFVPVPDNYLLLAGCTAGSIKLYDDVLGNQFNFPLREFLLGGFDVGDNSTVAVADIDNDGFFELLTGNRRGGLNFVNTPITTQGEYVGVADDVIIEDVVSIFPNPVVDMINISSPRIQLTSVQIYHLDGRLLLSKKMDRETQNSIDVSSLREGVYMVQLMTEDNKKIIKKVVKL